MTSNKKALISVGWLAVVPVADMIFEMLRQIGTTWTSNPGFFRLIALSLFVLVCIVAPLLLAVLVWLGQPAVLYKKLG